MQKLWTTARVEAELALIGQPASRQTIIVAIRQRKLPAIAILGRKERGRQIRSYAIDPTDAIAWGTARRLATKGEGSDGTCRAESDA